MGKSSLLSLRPGAATVFVPPDLLQLLFLLIYDDVKKSDKKQEEKKKTVGKTAAWVLT